MPSGRGSRAAGYCTLVPPVLPLCRTRSSLRASLHDPSRLELDKLGSPPSSASSPNGRRLSHAALPESGVIRLPELQRVAVSDVCGSIYVRHALGRTLSCPPYFCQGSLLVGAGRAANVESVFGRAVTTPHIVDQPTNLSEPCSEQTTTPRIRARISLRNAASVRARVSAVVVSGVASAGIPV